MSDHDVQLLEAARRVKPGDAGLAEAWHYLVEAIRVGWIDRPQMVELVAGLERREDFVVGELGLEFLEDRFRVSFIRNELEVSAVEFCQLVRSALREDSEHPGTITYVEGDRVVSVRNAAEVPEQARFARMQRGLVPIVKVVMRQMSDTMREIIEYGPSGERLRSTVQRKTPPDR
jgi:hypothetical protein